MRSYLFFNVRKFQTPQSARALRKTCLMHFYINSQQDYSTNQCDK